MATQSRDNISRSPIFILAYQLDGLCRGLVLAAQTQQLISELTYKVFQKFEADVRKVGSGGWMDGWPETAESPTLADLIVKAEVMRSAVLGFFTPDERDEYSRTSAFDLKNFRADGAS